MTWLFLLCESYGMIFFFFSMNVLAELQPWVHYRIFIALSMKALKRRLITKGFSMSSAWAAVQAVIFILSFEST